MSQWPEVAQELVKGTIMLGGAWLGWMCAERYGDRLECAWSKYSRSCACFFSKAWRLASAAVWKFSMRSCMAVWNHSVRLTSWRWRMKAKVKANEAPMKVSKTLDQSIGFEVVAAPAVAVNGEVAK